MFNVKTWLAGAGILLTIVGGVLVWKFSPQHFSGIIDDIDKQESIDREVGVRNRLMSLGGLLLLGGALLQLVANFL